MWKTGSSLYLLCLSYFDWLITISIDFKHNKQFLIHSNLQHIKLLCDWDRANLLTVRIELIEVNKSARPVQPTSNGKYLSQFTSWINSIDKRKHT